MISRVTALSATLLLPIREGLLVIQSLQTCTGHRYPAVTRDTALIHPRLAIFGEMQGWGPWTKIRRIIAVKNAKHTCSH